MSYKEKYLKYKLKYSALKKLVGGNIDFTNKADVSKSIQTIINYLAKINANILMDGYVYWINPYGGLCIQDESNYKKKKSCK